MTQFHVKVSRKCFIWIYADRYIIGPHYLQFIDSSGPVACFDRDTVLAVYDSDDCLLLDVKNCDY